jgi:hypothetical protein
MSVAEPSEASHAVTGPDDTSASGQRGGLRACLARLDEAIDAAQVLGLATADAEAVREEAGQ